jgi:hypothetical protein
VRGSGERRVSARPGAGPIQHREATRVSVIQDVEGLIVLISLQARGRQCTVHI